MNRKSVVISVVCPVYNEEDYISDLIHFFFNSFPIEKELFLIDGGSTDRTRTIISQYQIDYPNIILLENSQKYVPFALNKAIPHCSGDIIVRIDAHSDYELDYFEKILSTFTKTGADIVGGPTRTRFKTIFQEAVSVAICDSFAIGNSKVHQLDYEGYTDSVTFGAWRKEVFSKIGFFDTTLKRNQDDEFHYRARSKGLKIYQDPAIKLYYYPRSDARGLFRQYFEYGLYKPKVLGKIRSGMRVRHLIPSLFTIYLLLLLPLALISMYLYIPLYTYISLCLYKCIRLNTSNIKARIYLLLVFPIIHIAYGSGFLLGLNLVKKSGEHA